MELSVRLKTIASYIPSGKRVADIGTDHAHLPIYLVQNHIVPGALACDVRTGPLEHAAANIRSCGLDAVIETRLSDGLLQVKPNEAQTLVIAGMGGILIRRILEDGAQTATSMETWILEPQSDMELVREQIYHAGYHIEEESLVCEEGKYYPVIQAKKGNSDLPDPVQLKYGPVLLRKKDPMLYDALLKEEATLSHILKELYANNTEKAKLRAVEKERELGLVREAMKYYEMQ